MAVGRRRVTGACLRPTVAAKTASAFRRAISATGFTVLGIVNKLLTVVINLIIWDKHSTLLGTIGLLICMFGGVLYQQSTAKPKFTPEKVPVAQSGDDEQQLLLEMPMANKTDIVVT